MKLFKLLFEEDEKEIYTAFIPLKDLVVNYDSLFDAYDDCRYKKLCSKSEGPVEVYKIENESEKYQLYDGYHRLFEYLLNLKHKENNGKILVKVDNSYLTKEYWAVTPESKRWIYDGSKKYGNLENFFGKNARKELDGIAKEFFDRKKGPNNETI